MNKGIIYVKIALNFILFILGIVLAIVFLPKLLRFFMPFVIGGVISMIANPLVRFLEKKVKIVRKHSSALIIIVAIGVIVGGLYGIIAVIIRETSYLMKDMSHIINNIEQVFESASLRLNYIYELMPEPIQNMLDKIVAEISGYGSNAMDMEDTPIFQEASNVVSNMADILLKSIITVLSAYFFIAERENIGKRVRYLVPKSILEGYHLIAYNFKTAVGGYFKAQFKIMLVLVGIIFIGLEVLKVDYSFLLAILIAFLDFLPFFGTGLIIWPWALMDFIVGNYVRAIGFVVIYLICQIVKQVLQPKMVGASIGISPLSTLIFMFVGYQLMGVLGMILGIPIGMVLVNFYRIGMFDRLLRGLQIVIHDLNEFRKF